MRYMKEAIPIDISRTFEDCQPAQNSLLLLIVLKCVYKVFAYFRCTLHTLSLYAAVALNRVMALLWQWVIYWAVVDGFMRSTCLYSGLNILFTSIACVMVFYMHRKDKPQRDCWHRWIERNIKGKFSLLPCYRAAPMVANGCVMEDVRIMYLCIVRQYSGLCDYEFKHDRSKTFSNNQ